MSKKKNAGKFKRVISIITTLVAITFVFTNIFNPIFTKSTIDYKPNVFKGKKLNDNNVLIIANKDGKANLLENTINESELTFSVKQISEVVLKLNAVNNKSDIPDNVPYDKKRGGYYYLSFHNISTRNYTSNVNSHRKVETIFIYQKHSGLVNKKTITTTTYEIEEYQFNVVLNDVARGFNGVDYPPITVSYLKDNYPNSYKFYQALKNGDNNEYLGMLHDLNKTINTKQVFNYFKYIAVKSKKDVVLSLGK